MKIIDFHTHIYPAKIAEKATTATSEFYKIDTDIVGTSRALLELGKGAGISQFVLLPVATNPEQVHDINKFTLEEVRAHIEFHGFGTLHPKTKNKLVEAEFIINSGLKGIKFHPDIQKFDADDKRLFEVYDYIQGKIPILMHCGDKRYNFSNPRKLKNVIDKFPRLQVIAAHLGGWSMFDAAFEYLRNTDCYLDISSCMMFLPPDSIVKYILGYGSDRILFGTDFPLWNPREEVASLNRLNLSTDDLEKIAYKNAENILSRS